MRIPLIILTAGLLSSCAQTSFEEFGKKIDSAIRGDGSQVASNVQNSEVTYSLNINADPSDSRVKIMNIKPRYQAGIRLQPGSYDVLVQKDGYQDNRQWVTISNSSITRNVTLTPAPQIVSSASESPAAESEVVKSETSKLNQQLTEPESQEAVKPQVKKEEKTAQASKAVDKATLSKKPKAVASNNKLRADYRPPEIDIPSELKPAELTDDEQPKFNGAYIKTVEEGFFADTVKFVEMTESPAYKSVVFRATKKQSIGITWLVKQKKKYFAFEDADGIITIPRDQFKGVVVKGKSAEYVSLHRAERMVRGYDPEGGNSGGISTFFDSNKNVRKGEAVYIPMDNEKSNSAKLSDDSYFISFKEVPEKGLFIAWVGDHFWFFNLI